MFLSDACPIFVEFFEAPTTAILFGLKNVSSDCFISSSSLSFLFFLDIYFSLLKHTEIYYVYY